MRIGVYHRRFLIITQKGVKVKKLFLIVLAFGFLGFSSASADIQKDYTLGEIIQVVNSPTKNIVEQDIGDEVMKYMWYEGNDFLEIPGEYESIRGKIVDKGIEQDSKGRDYNFVIAYFKNDDTTQGNFIKFTQYKTRLNSLFVLSGISTVNLPVVHFRMIKDSWTNIYPYNETGGYGKGSNKVNFAAL